MPTEAENWEQRHRAILAILRRSPVRRQEELVARLAERGFEVTQSSVSRSAGFASNWATLPPIPAESPSATFAPKPSMLET